MGGILSSLFVFLFIFCMYSYWFLSSGKNKGVKFCTHVRLLSGKSFSHFGELWPRGVTAAALLPGCMRPLTDDRRRLPARLGGDSELGAMARWGSQNWGQRRWLRPYGGICVLQACWHTCSLILQLFAQVNIGTTFRAPAKQIANHLIHSDCLGFSEAYCCSQCSGQPTVWTSVIIIPHVAMQLLNNTCTSTLII